MIVVTQCTISVGVRLKAFIGLFLFRNHFLIFKDLWVKLSFGQKVKYKETRK